jgi:hypothetical protein
MKSRRRRTCYTLAAAIKLSAFAPGRPGSLRLPTRRPPISPEGTFSLSLRAKTVQMLDRPEACDRIVAMASNRTLHIRRASSNPELAPGHRRESESATPLRARRRGRRYLLSAFALIVVAATAFVGVWFHNRYATSDQMLVPIREYSSAEYPEDPADKSINYGRYSDRRLKLIRRGATHFDFVFEPVHSHVATVVFRNVDVSLMTPSEPSWTKGNRNLERIALIDRQWNRQQVSFARGSKHLEVSGGNGFERDNLVEADLAKNCLNAGLWEVLLFNREDGQPCTTRAGLLSRSATTSRSSSTTPESLT